MNLESDLVALLHQLITTMGYTVPTLSSDRDTGILYFNLLKRRIKPSPRTIHKSPRFTCPTGLATGLLMTEGEITRGEDLNPRLSRKIDKPDYDDPLLNAWGINHLHLGERRDAKKPHLIEGTKDILFAMIRPNDAYLIAIDGHVWTKQQMVEAIHAHWPQVIEQYKLPGVRLQSTPTDDDHAAMRAGKAKSNAFLQMTDGTVYAPTGGGVMGDGTSFQAVRSRDQVIKRVRSYQADLIQRGVTAAALEWQASDGHVVVRIPGDPVVREIGLILPTW